MRQFLSVTLLACALVWAAGCGDNKTTSIDEQATTTARTTTAAEREADATEAEIVAEIEAEEQEDDNPFAFLAFWNWGDDGEAAEPEPVALDDEEIAYMEEEEEEGPLEFLAFWNWFGDDDEEEGEEEDERTRPITRKDVLGDMSPELVNLAETRDETKIRRARVLDTNTRGIWDDLHRFFLFERPSRLTMYPIR